jgi:cbb3-type cytochrome oxidase subunit 3
VIATSLQLATAGTTTFAGALTLVLPIALVIVVLGIWWVALRRGRTAAADAASTTPARGEEPPPALHGP